MSDLVCKGTPRCWNTRQLNIGIEITVLPSGFIVKLFRCTDTRLLNAHKSLSYFFHRVWKHLKIIIHVLVL